jgi:hypothetical protein
MFFKITFPSVENCLISNSGLVNDAASIFKCPSVKKIIKEIKAIFNRSGLTALIEIKKSNIMLTEGHLKIDAASFHRCLLYGRDGIFRLTNSFFKSMFI